MDVSVIIVNYNTLKLTQDCINSVFSKTKGLEFEIILVDNASSDGSKDFFSKDKRIRYIYCDVNLGFGKANNLGFKYAQGDYIFLLNSDTYLLNNAIYLLWKGFVSENEKEENVACAGCMLKDAEGDTVHSYAKFPSKTSCILSASVFLVLWKIHLIRSIPSTNNYDYKENASKDLFDVDYITGADLMVKRTVAEQYGLFDPDFFMYFEESEMQHRYMRYGFRRVVVNGPKIVHLERKSNPNQSPKRVTMFRKSQFQYFKKTNSIVIYYIFSLLYKFIYVITYLICFPFIHGTSRDKIEHLEKLIMM